MKEHFEVGEHMFCALPEVVKQDSDGLNHLLKCADTLPDYCIFSHRIKHSRPITISLYLRLHL